MEFWYVSHTRRRRRLRRACSSTQCHLSLCWSHIQSTDNKKRLRQNFRRLTTHVNKKNFSHTILWAGHLFVYDLGLNCLKTSLTCDKVASIGAKIVILNKAEKTPGLQAKINKETTNPSWLQHKSFRLDILLRSLLYRDCYYLKIKIELITSPLFKPLNR